MQSHIPPAAVLIFMISRKRKIIFIAFALVPLLTGRLFGDFFNNEPTFRLDTQFAYAEGDGSSGGDGDGSSGGSGDGSSGGSGDGSSGADVDGSSGGVSDGSSGGDVDGSVAGDVDGSVGGDGAPPGDGAGDLPPPQSISSAPPAAACPVPPPVITSATSTTGTVGTPFSFTITATNSPTSFGAAPLPAGLSLNPTTGVISGTPTAAGTTDATVSASNECGTGTGPLRIIINAVPAAALSCSPATQTIAAGGSATFNAVGGTAPYSWTSTGNPATSTGPTLTATFINPGPGSATVTDATSATATCNVTASSGGGGGGAPPPGGGGGGGPPPGGGVGLAPLTTLQGQRFNPVLASYITLTQIPFTGVSDTARVATFVSVLSVWSFYIAYRLVRRNAPTSSFFNRLTFRERPRDFLDL